MVKVKTPSVRANPNCLYPAVVSRTATAAIKTGSHAKKALPSAVNQPSCAQGCQGSGQVKA